MFHVPNQYRVREHKILGSNNEAGNNGFFMFAWRGYHIRVQASDGFGWEHCSVTINRNHTPSWEIMSLVKALFWDAEDCIIQYHPPESKYINMHPHCLHLWRKTGYEFPLPDGILIGVNQSQKKEGE